MPASAFLSAPLGALPVWAVLVAIVSILVNHGEEIEYNASWKERIHRTWERGNSRACRSGGRCSVSER